MIYGNRFLNMTNVVLLGFLIVGFSKISPLWGGSYILYSILWFSPFVAGLVVFSADSNFFALNEELFMVRNYLRPTNIRDFALDEITKVTVARIPTTRGGHSFVVVVATPLDELHYKTNLLNDADCLRLIADLKSLGVKVDYEGDEI